MKRKAFNRVVAICSAAMMLAPTLPVMAAESGSGEVTGDSYIEGVMPSDVLDVVVPTLTNDTYKLILDPHSLLSQYDTNKDKYTASKTAYFANVTSAGTPASVTGIGTLYKDDPTNARKYILTTVDDKQAIIDACVGKESTAILSGYYKDDQGTAATVADAGYTAAVPGETSYTDTSDTAVATNKSSVPVLFSVNVSVANVKTNPVTFTASTAVEADKATNVAISLVPTAKGTVQGNANPTPGDPTTAQKVDVDTTGKASLTFLVGADKDSNFGISQEADTSAKSGHKYVYTAKDNATWSTVGFALSAASNSKADWTEFNKLSQKKDATAENLEVKVVYSMQALTDAQQAEVEGTDASAVVKDGVTIYKNEEATTEATSEEILAACVADTDHSDGINGLYTAENVKATTAAITYTAAVAAKTADATTAVIALTAAETGIQITGATKSGDIYETTFAPGTAKTLTVVDQTVKAVKWGSDASAIEKTSANITTEGSDVKIAAAMWSGQSGATKYLAITLSDDTVLKVKVTVQ